jgi:hypothetical protein
LGVNIDLGGTDGIATIDEVQWFIAKFPDLGTPVAAGVINTSQPGSTASFEQFGLSQGDYGVLLTATSTDGLTLCSGQAGLFNVTPGSTTEVFMLLNCVTEERLGALRVNGEFNRCAELTMVTVSPLVVSVGFNIDVTAMSDDDEGDAVVFRWTATGGTIDDDSEQGTPGESTTFYTCADIGTQTIMVEVSDDASQGVTANSPLPSFSICNDTWDVAVECVAAPLCGNGVINPPGEECDPPDLPAPGLPDYICDPTTCLRIPNCGDLIVDAPGEDCDPPDGVFCDASCQDIDPCSPNLCDDSDSCTTNACSADPVDNTAVCAFPEVPVGTPCDDFLPNSGVCLGSPRTCTEVPDAVTQTVTVVASNSVTGDISDLPYILTVTPLGPVPDGVPSDFSVTGSAFFPVVFLQIAIQTIPGLTEVTLVADGLSGTPHARSGTTGAPEDLATLGFDGTLPTLVPIPLTSDPLFCGPLNVSTCLNTCTDASACAQPAPDTCVDIGDESCVPRGACTCVNAPLELPMTAAVVTVTPDISATGDILFGWNEDVLPPQSTIFDNPVGPQGIRVIAVVLQVAIEGWMGQCVDGGGIPVPGCTDAIDLVDTLPDADLLAIPISP